MPSPNRPTWRPDPPQPSVDRIAPVLRRPLVVAVTPGQPDLVVRTAAEWATALGGAELLCAYVDPTRAVVAEFADGSVRHTALDPDGVDDSWLDRDAGLRAQIGAALGTQPSPGHAAWRFHYLAGRADRALTHLARAAGASAYVVGTHRPGLSGRAHEVLETSLAVRLTHHQHRPVLVVPLSVVDWHARPPWA